MVNYFLELRKQILEDEYSHLNSMQMQSVFFTGNPLLILAGAGSGKTTVIVNKIGYLIKYGNTYEDTTKYEKSEDDINFLKQCLKDKSLRKGEKYFSLMKSQPVAERNLLAITFTNKAAGEMRERLQSQFNISADQLWALTFHSLCVRILRNFIQVLGFNNNFTIYDDNDSNKLIENILKDMNISETYHAKVIHKLISKAKTGYISANEYDKKIHNIEFPKTGEIYKRYQKQLHDANALDFDDLIFFTVKLLSENAEIKQRVNNRFKYVLVDEYQDTNPLQYKLVSMLVSDGKICVVGDDDQSIYKFMGASIDNILSFERSFQNAKVIKLEQNYRSTSNILNAANAVISNNSNRKGKNLWTSKSGGDKIHYHLLNSSIEEAEFIAKTVITGVSTGMKYNQFSVLYRTHSQSRQIEMALKGNGIPYKVFGGLAFFKRKEIQDILAYLNVINNPSDKTRLMRIINEPKRGIGDTTLSKIHELAELHFMTDFDIMCHADEYPELARASLKLKNFTDMIKTLNEKSKSMTLTDFYPYLLEVTGYLQMISGLEMRERILRRDNLQELLNTITDYVSRAETPSLIQFLEEMALISAVDDLQEDDNVVTLMTIHCAKGLEFDNVFISGFEDGLFPSEMSIGEEDGIEEERRLCYVAITRARLKLYILSAKMRMAFGMMKPCESSRFLKEIPEEFMDKTVPVQRDFSARKDSKVKINHMQHILDQDIKEFSVSKSTPKISVKYETGMKVKHKIFGQGVILSVTPMSSDTMLEVEFAAGNKKLMANYAKMEIL